MKPLDCLDVYSDAEFYDLEFAKRAHEIPFFVDEARIANGSVLEVGCGTGRLTLPIARGGIKVTGLEISHPMLELARQKAQKEQLVVTWLEQDCRNIESDENFALIFSAANAMQHLHDFESVNSFLRSARKALRPDGKLILDVFNPDPAKLARQAGCRYHLKTIINEAGREIRVETESEYFSVAQILAFTLFYLCEGHLVRTKKVTMRCFYPEELLAICRFNGFEITERHGNYDRTDFANDSPKQILLCRKNFKT